MKSKEYTIVLTYLTDRYVKDEGDKKLKEYLDKPDDFHSYKLESTNSLKSVLEQFMDILAEELDLFTLEDMGERWVCMLFCEDEFIGFYCLWQECKVSNKIKKIQ